MKLAEALSIRADLQKRIAQLRERLKNSSKVQEGDVPVEDPKELFKELDGNGVSITKKDGLSGLRTGFVELDKLTSGWQNSDLVVIAARPSMGKTAFVLSMIENIAVNDKISVAFFSIEMSIIQIVNRLISTVCEISSSDIENGRLKQFEREQLDHKINDLYDAPIYMDDTPALSVSELQTKAYRLIREHKVKCIFIDYLQLMTVGKMNFDSREQEHAILRTLKKLAKALNIPIIVMSQLYRSARSTSDKRPQLSDLRGFEQNADTICIIHRPEYYGIYEDSQGNSLCGIAEIIVCKHRNGETGIVTLNFNREYMKFTNRTSAELRREIDSCSQQLKALEQHLNELDMKIQSLNWAVELE